MIFLLSQEVYGIGLSQLDLDSTYKVQPSTVNTMPTAGYRQRLRSVQAINYQLSTINYQLSTINYPKR